MHPGNSIELRAVAVGYPRHKIPTLKEWVVRGITGNRPDEFFWALRDVTLEVKQGEAFGIIGRNGAGKSTLLRVAAGIIVPTEGEALVRGSIAPLIELGTGFDGELTGIENIFFNGALLGRSRAYMTRRLDAIVNFAGLGAFIDEPLRTYSTGMVARLAFSIATTVDADTVLLDEILSVGDASFQEQCNERIRDFHSSGATLVLVSHDLKSIRTWCSRVAWIEQGIVRLIGRAEEVIDAYERSVHPTSSAALM